MNIVKFKKKKIFVKIIIKLFFYIITFLTFCYLLNFLISIKGLESNNIDTTENVFAKTIKNFINEIKKHPRTSEQIKKSGFKNEDLKKFGFKVKDFKQSGFKADELRKKDTDPQKQTLLFSLLELKEEGYGLKELKDLTKNKASNNEKAFTLEDFKEVGFKVKDLYESGYNLEELKGVGFKVKDFKKAGFNADQLRKTDTDPQKQTLLFSLLELIEGGYGLEELKEVGFEAKDFIKAGLNVDQLRKTDSDPQKQTLLFSLLELKEGGCELKDLKDLTKNKASNNEKAFTLEDLKEVGFEVKDFIKAGFNADQLRKTDTDPQKQTLLFSLLKLKEGGYGLEELKDLTKNKASNNEKAFTLEDLKEVGFEVKDFIKAGFYADQLRKTDSDPQKQTLLFSLLELKEGGCELKDLKDLTKNKASNNEKAFTLEDFKKVGFKVKDLYESGYNLEELKEVGFEAKDFIKAGLNVDQLRKTDSDPQKQTLLFSLLELKEGGCELKDLKDLTKNKASNNEKAFTLEDLKEVGFEVKDFIKAGFNADQLRKTDTDPQKQTLLFSLLKLKEGGYGLEELKDLTKNKASNNEKAFTLEDLKEVGFEVKDFIKAGFYADQLRKTDSDPQKQTLLFSLLELKEGGCELKDLKDLTKNKASNNEKAFTLEDFKKIGFKVKDLYESGYNLEDLKEVGFEAKDFKKAGLNADQLRKTDTDPQKQTLLFSLLKLKEGGYGLEELKDLTKNKASNNEKAFTLEDLKEVGFEVKDFIKAGFYADQLRKIDSDPQKQTLLFSLLELKEGGYGLEELKDLTKNKASNNEKAFTLEDLKEVGFEAKDFKQSGFNADQLRKTDTDPQKQTLLFSLLKLKEGGYGLEELKDLTKNKASNNEKAFTLEDLKEVGFEVKDFIKAGLNVDQLRKTDSDPQKQTLLFSLLELKEGGCELKDLKDLTKNKASNNEKAFTLEDFKKIGFKVKDLYESGYNLEDLKEVGFEAKDFKQSGFNADQLRKTDTDPQKQTLLFSLEKLIEGEYDLEELKEDGFKVKDFIKAGLNVDQLRKTDSDPQKQTLLFSLLELKEGGCELKDLKDLTKNKASNNEKAFTLEDFKKVDFKVKDLYESGYNLEDLKEVGFEAKDFKQSGFNADQLRKTDADPQKQTLLFSLEKLIEGEYDLEELKVLNKNKASNNEKAFDERELEKNFIFSQSNKLFNFLYLLLAIIIYFLLKIFFIKNKKNKII